MGGATNEKQHAPPRGGHEPTQYAQPRGGPRTSTEPTPARRSTQPQPQPNRRPRPPKHADRKAAKTTPNKQNKPRMALAQTPPQARPTRTQRRPPGGTHDDTSSQAPPHHAQPPRRTGTNTARPTMRGATRRHSTPHHEGGHAAKQHALSWGGPRTNEANPTIRGATHQHNTNPGQANSTAPNATDPGTTNQHRNKQDHYTNNIRPRKRPQQRQGTNAEQADHEAADTTVHQQNHCSGHDMTVNRPHASRPTSNQPGVHGSKRERRLTGWRHHGAPRPPTTIPTNTAEHRNSTITNATNQL